MTASQIVGLMMLFAVFAFVIWQFLHGGGKPENGHEPGSYW